MQDKIIASHTCFGGHMDVNCYNICGFGRPFFCSLIFLPVHPYLYPSIFVFTHPNDGWMGGRVST